ncbi:MFS transporter [Rhodococcus tukisamuensis]|uniref:Major Facilitator Superfamily protein n=1 Tax=Rhodococcus tukisamuensis TaxID=168276 RepID=A0A1G6NGS1_9NOCA|nr:MFS transporter [Rhodococcus tukisamuensis]SDC67022.1 Major Facilitator Superfamily protein [Rhodococcus tukisamuensis]
MSAGETTAPEAGAAGTVQAPVAESVFQDPARARRVVAVLSLSGVLVSLQQTLVVPILPDFAVALNVSSATASWMVTATLLTSAVATPLIGRLADLFGKRSMMLVCLAVMVLGSAVAALGQVFPVVVAGRVMQGFAMALLPVGISLMRDVLPRERLGGAVALMSATLGIGGMIGMPLAGVIYEHLGWEALFWVSGAGGLLLAALLLAVVPESAVRSQGRFDFAGALLLTVALTGLLLAVSKGGEWGWTGVSTLTCAAVGLAASAAWIPLELRIREPLVDLRTTVLRPVLVSNICAVLLGFAMFLSAYTATQELQAPVESGYGPGLSETQAGLAMLPGGLLMVLLAPLSARMSRRHGAQATLMVGAVAIAVGYAVRAVLGSAVLNVTVSAAIISGGVALALAAMPVLITEAAPADQTASANGVNSLLRSVGTSTASAVGAAVLATSTVTAAGVTVPTIGAFNLLYWLGAVVSLAAVAVTLCVPARARVRS